MSANVGRVLNRFSKDVGLIDALLPHQTMEFLNVSLRVEIFLKNELN